jgi:NADPH-dependent curcumin reductase CurA
VKVLWLSFDPTQRGWLNDMKSYMPPVQIGEVMRAFAVGQVVESQNPKWAPGDVVQGMLRWADYVVVEGGAGLDRVPPDLAPQTYLGIYGTTGLTAYFGMIDIGEPKAGETVVVSGAAGATGSVAGQLAKSRGARVVGIAGGPAKCSWLTDVAGFDAAVDYKTGDVSGQLRAIGIGGIDVYYDNVGGPLLDVMLARLNRFARVVICGGISSGYGPDAENYAPKNYFNLVFTGSKMQGFLLTHYLDRFDEARAELRRLVESGQIVYEEDIQEGLEQAPDTLNRLFEGRNLGKQLLKVADPDPI